MLLLLLLLIILILILILTITTTTTTTTTTTDLSSENLKAFQRLWNRNSGDDELVLQEDGLYGPMTAEALNRAPCDGW